MSAGKRAGGWSFEPDWLIGGGDKDHAVLEELSTCPSWLTLENTRQHNSSSLNLTSHAIAKRIDALADTDAAAATLTRESERAGHELREARNQISILQAELHQREALTRHTKAQNLVLRSELAGFKKNVADLNNELKDLHDHVHFLRHITAPTPDAGALDASLAMLRGHELEQARSREKETRAALCTSETAREQVQMDLENERQSRNASETSYQSEIDRLNLEIARFSALHTSREHRNLTDEARHRDLLAHQEKHLASVKEDLRREREEAVALEAKKWRAEILRHEERQMTLTAEIDDLKQTIEALGTKSREQADQLELAYAEIHGRGLQDPRQDADRATIDRELSKQREKLLAEFNRERTELRRELAQLRQLEVTPGMTPPRRRTSYEEEKGDKLTPDSKVHSRDMGVNTEKDPLLERLGAYHTQLQLATDELSRASEDNKYLFGKLVAAFCAIEAARRISEQQQKKAMARNAHADAHVDPGVARSLHAQIRELEESQDKLGALAEMWEDQANELEATLAERERVAVLNEAALRGAQQSVDQLQDQLANVRKEFESRMKAERNHLEHKLDQAGDALERSARRIEDQEHRLSALNGKVEDLERTKSVLEADLAIAENEVIRLRTELARKKMELSRTERSRSHASTQTDPTTSLALHTEENTQSHVEALRRERKRWEAEKNRELKAMQKKFASSFKKQVAKVLGARPEIPRSEALEMSLVSVDSADPLEAPPSTATTALGGDARSNLLHFNLQDCTPPVTSLDPNAPAPALRGGVWMPDSMRHGRNFPTVPRDLLSTELGLERPQKDTQRAHKENASGATANRRWDPEESYARWKKQQERKKASAGSAMASSPPYAENKPVGPRTKSSKATSVSALRSSPLSGTPSRLPLRPTNEVTPVRTNVKSRATPSSARSTASRIPKPSSARSNADAAFASSTTPTFSGRKAGASKFAAPHARSPPSPPPYAARRKTTRVRSTTSTPSTASPPSGRRRPAFR